MFFSKSARKEVENGIKPIFPRLWRYCLVLTGNKDWADDLAQAVCLKAIEKADLFQEGTHLDRCGGCAYLTRCPGPRTGAVTRRFLFFGQGGRKSRGNVPEKGVGDKARPCQEKICGFLVD